MVDRHGIVVRNSPPGRSVPLEVSFVVIVWILVTVALVAVELHHLAFFALFGAIGAGAAAVVAAFAPDAVAVQILVAVVVAAIGVVLVRPQMSQAFARRGPGVRIVGVHGGLIGERAVTLDDVGHHTAGHVRLHGESWLAVTADGTTISPSTPVIITKVAGTTLTVRAADDIEELR